MQSITNKSCLIHDHILEKSLDFMCITETWHQPNTFSSLNESCPQGYSYLQKARSTGRGGGLSVIYRSDLDLSLQPLPELSSFECLAFKCKSPSPVLFLLIYRPPKSNPSFITEMSNLLNFLHILRRCYNFRWYEHPCWHPLLSFFSWISSTTGLF